MIKEQEPETVQALLEAIDGLKEGNAPGMHIYKGCVYWGNAMKKYLRS